MGDVDVWIRMPAENCDIVEVLLPDFVEKCTDNGSKVWYDSTVIHDDEDDLTYSDCREGLYDLMEYRWLLINLGVYKIINLDFWEIHPSHHHPQPKRIGPTIQLILLDFVTVEKKEEDEDDSCEIDLVSDHRSTWDEIHAVPYPTLSVKIVSEFDLDVCKCFYVFDSEGDIIQVRFLSVDIERSVRRGTSSIQFRPCNPASMIQKRIAKYEERGFSINKWTVDSRCTWIWKNFLLVELGIKKNSGIYFPHPLNQSRAKKLLGMETIVQLWVKDGMLPNALQLNMVRFYDRWTRRGYENHRNLEVKLMYLIAKSIHQSNGYRVHYG